MSNTTNTTKNRSNSKFLGHRRKRQFLRDFKNFSEKHDAMIWIIDWGGMYRCITQTEDSRNAFAWGATRKRAFYNMIRMYNLKYVA